MKSVCIGENCRVGYQVIIYYANFHEISLETRNRSAGKSEPLVIGNNVWIGSKAIILKVVTIGDNSVIDACSLFAKLISLNVIASGVPVKVIRNIGSET